MLINKLNISYPELLLSAVKEKSKENKSNQRKLPSDSGVAVRKVG